MSMHLRIEMHLFGPLYEFKFIRGLTVVSIIFWLFLLLKNDVEGMDHT